jgi:hypothetical protein
MGTAPVLTDQDGRQIACPAYGCRMSEEVLLAAAPLIMEAYLLMDDAIADGILEFVKRNMTGDERKVIVEAFEAIEAINTLREEESNA